PMRLAMSARSPATRPVASAATAAGVGAARTWFRPGRLRSPTSKLQAARRRVPISARATCLVVMIPSLVEAQLDGGPEAPARRERREVDVPVDGIVAEIGNF